MIPQWTQRLQQVSDQNLMDIEQVDAVLGVPTLHLETDYAESDTEQLRVRIEAYLEML